MRCPFCQSDDTKVLDTRLIDDGSQVRRRRECTSCGERYSTRETVDLNLPRLIKSERIERKLMTQSEREVPSAKIGEWVMEELKALDEVAYIRFASVYRQFQDIEAFKNEIDKLMHK